MVSPDRRQATTVALFTALKAKPEAYRLFDSLRLIERRQVSAERLGRSLRPAQDPVKIGQEVSLAFAHADIADFSYQGQRPSLINTAYGIFGPNGPQPLVISEYAFDRKHNYNDAAFHRFADIFHHRCISLLYRAWANTQAVIEVDNTQSNRFTDYISALAACLPVAADQGQRTPQNHRLFHAGLFKQETRSFDGLSQLIASVFQVPVSVTPLTGGWLALDSQHQLHLGPGVQLGVNRYLGARAYACQHRFTLNIGVIHYRQFLHLLPHTDSYQQLLNLVSEYAGIEFEWDLNVTIDSSTLPRWQLGRDGGLGWNLWLGASTATSANNKTTTIHFPARNTALYEPLLSTGTLSKRDHL